MLLTSKAVFLMIPRTGSTWCRQAMRNAGVGGPSGKARPMEWGGKHSVVLPSGQYAPPTAGFRFTIVRDPATWVRSRWTLGPWEDELKTLWCPDPVEFAAKVSGPMVEMYFAKYKALASFVGNFESLADDLVKALTMCGEQFNERELRRTPKINESDGRLQSGAFFDMTEKQWLGLPGEELVNMPAELLAQLPDEAFAKFTPDQSRQIIQRLTIAAVRVPPRSIPVRLSSDAA